MGRSSPVARICRRRRPRRSGAGGAVLAAAVSFGALGSSGPFRAETDAPVSLGRGVPSDSLLYLHYRLGGPDGLDRHDRPEGSGEPASCLRDLARAASASGFFDELASWLVDAVRSAATLPDPAREGAAAGEPMPTLLESPTDREHWLELLEGVPWSALFSTEVALAIRPGAGRREMLFLARAGPRIDEVLTGLRRLSYATCALSPAFEITESWQGDAKVLVLHDLINDEALSLAGQGDVVVLATSTRLLRHSLQLLSGTSRDLGFGSTDARVRMLEALGAELGDPAEVDFELQVRVGALFAEIPALASLDSFVAAGSGDGAELRYAYGVRFSPGTSGSLRSALLDRAGLEAGLRWVPRGVPSYEVVSGPSSDALRRLLAELLVETLPQGPALAARWGLLEGDGAREDRSPVPLLLELLSMLSGRGFSVGSPDGIALLRELKDPEAARARYPALRARLEGWLRSLGLEPERLSPAGWDGDLLSVEVPWGAAGADGASGAPRRRAVLLGLAGDSLAVATSVELLGRAVAARSGSEEGDAPEDLDPGRHGAGSGKVFQVRRAEAGYFVELGRLGLALLRAASRAESGPDEEGGLAARFADALSRLSPALGALGAIRSEESRLRGEEDALRGGGILRFHRREKGPRERRF